MFVENCINYLYVESNLNFVRALCNGVNRFYGNAERFCI